MVQAHATAPPLLPVGPVVAVRRTVLAEAAAAAALLATWTLLWSMFAATIVAP